MVYLPTFTIEINHPCIGKYTIFPWIRHGNVSVSKVNLTSALHLPALWRHCRWEELWRFPQVPWFEGKISSGKNNRCSFPCSFLENLTFLQQQRDTKLHSCFLLFLLCYCFWLCLMFLSVWKLWMETPPKKHQKREIWESYRVDNLKGFCHVYDVVFVFPRFFVRVSTPQVTQRVAPFWKTPKDFTPSTQGIGHGWQWSRDQPGVPGWSPWNAGNDGMIPMIHEKWYI